MRRRRLLLVTATAATVASSVTLVATAAVHVTPAPRVDMPFAMTLRIMNEQAGRYQVEVTNTNPTRFVSSFNWTPPAGMNVVSITSSVGGKCHLSTDGIIACTGLAAPPTSAQGVGASLVVNFVANGRQPTFVNGYWIHYGVLGSVSVQMSKFNDLPICKKGQKNTAAHPCATL